MRHYGTRDDWDERIAIPNTLLKACRIGVEPGIANTDMYDRLLAATPVAGVREVFYNRRARPGTITYRASSAVLRVAVAPALPTVCRRRR